MMVVMVLMIMVMVMGMMGMMGMGVEPGLWARQLPSLRPNPAGSAAGCVLRRDRPASSNRGRQTEAIRGHEAQTASLLSLT